MTVSSLNNMLQERKHVDAIASRRPRRVRLVSPRWESFQATPTSQRLLSRQARHEGHAVLRIPADLREMFLDVAWVFLLYDRLFQTPRRPLSPAHVARFVAWSEATHALVAALRKEENHE